MYVSTLRNEDFEIPNLSRQIEQSPQMFVQILSLVYKRRDKEKDPEELFGFDVEKREDLFTAAYSLLDTLRFVPGTDKDGKINPTALAKWILEVRALCKKYSREDVGDQTIGQILSECDIGNDGIWPCEPVRQVLEDIASKQIARGMSIGVYNARGANFRDAIGNQERDLAKKYRSWSQELSFEYPYVAGLLEDIARSYDHDAEWWQTRENIRKRNTY